jgi:hypothetical protein
VKPVSGCSELVDRAVRQAAENFFARTPSKSTLGEEALRRTTESILSQDPHETDGTIHPDNSLAAVPFRPEVARYGGPDLLPHSLDFFTISSIAALDFLTCFGEEPRSRQLILAFRLLLRQALGFASDPDELLLLLSYGVLSWGKLYPAILAKGERVFATQREVLCGLFNQGISEVASEVSANGTAACLCKAAQILSRIVGWADLRRSIGVSQLHMTATRIGLSNPEEAYISHLLSAAAQSILAVDSAALSRLAQHRRQSSTLSLEALLQRAFALLGAS